MPAFRQEEEGKDPDRFQISHRDRELLMLIAGAYNNKIIAASLDIALRTVYQRIEEICILVKVEDRFQLALWIMQQEEDPTLPGSWLTRGLHKAPCRCGKPGCIWGLLQATLMRPTVLPLPQSLSKLRELAMISG